MANVISSLLVGIGFDFDKKSAKEVDSGIDGIKSKALQLGAVVAGAYGIKKLATDFADSADMLGKFSETFGGTASDIQALGSALTTEGGSLESFMGQLESLERARARIKVGDVAFFAPAGKAGLDPNVIANAESATDAYIGLADAFARMNQQERINAAEALGLDSSSIRLLSQGRESVDLLVEKYKTIRPLTDQMTESAAEFNKQWVEVRANVGSVTDGLGYDFVNKMNGPLDKMNGLISENRELIKESLPFVNNVLSSGFIVALSSTADKYKQIGSLTEYMTKSATALNERWIEIKTNVASVADNLTGGDDDAFNKGVQTATDFTGSGFLVALSNMAADYVSNVMNEGSPSSPEINVIDVLKAESRPSFLDITGYATKGTLYDTSNSMYNKGQSNQQTINVNASFTLDGQIIDRKIVKVVDGMAQNAIDDISSSTGG
mgnify:CR=1 FL=1|tara:strand:- start:8337 stop:9650 length:1314 start_codon:yes stop_codon:yes gene_type:complete